MTKTYHDVEAVTRLLEEKEKDLELAAKIGQELLERNRTLDDKVNRLEAELASYQELIIQLKHEVQVKTDLLHVYSSDLEDSSPLELRSINVEILQRKIQDLEEDNRTLHAEASKLAHEAYACEEKEERLVTDAVKHLTEANHQIKDLHSQFTNKIDESSRQRGEISMLLAQVCELQSRVQKYTHENDDLTANLRVYQETQDDLTTELCDLKDKYREVVELLRDTQEQLRSSRKRTYPGMGKHSVSGMFSLPIIPSGGGGSGPESLAAEINSSLSCKKSSRNMSKVDSEISDSESDIPIHGSSAYRKAARTYKAIARGQVKKDKEMSSSKSSVKSAFQSYTISRENSFSPDFEEFEFAGKKLYDDIEASDDSGHGRSTEMSGPDSLSSSAPREEFRARELLRQATQNRLQSSQYPVPEFDLGHELQQALGPEVSLTSTLTSTRPHSSLSDFPLPGYMSGTSSRPPSRPGEMYLPLPRPQHGFVPYGDRPRDQNVEVIEVQTVGVLRPPSFHLSSSLLQATPLGSVPGSTRGKVGGSLPATPSGVGGGFDAPSAGGHPALGTIPGRRFSEKLEMVPHRESSDFDETEPLGQLTNTQGSGLGQVSSGFGQIPFGLGQVPSGFGQVPSSLGQIPSGFGQVPSSLGQLPSGFGQVPSSLGQVPSGFGQVPSGLGQVPSHPYNLSSGEFDETSSCADLPLTLSSQPKQSLGRLGQPPVLSRAGHSGMSRMSLGGSGSPYLSSGHSRAGDESSLHQDLEFDLSELGSISDLMSEDETEPIQSFSLTSTSLSRRIDCQIVGGDRTGSGISGIYSTDNISGISTFDPEEWSFSDLRSSGVQSLHLQPDRTPGAGIQTRGSGSNARIPDSGVTSGDYTEDLSAAQRQDLGMPDIDALSDGGFCEMGTYPGIQISDRPGVPEELASTLRHLNLKEVERRRRLLSNNTSFDVAECAGDSEIAGYETEEEILPYGLEVSNPRYGLEVSDQRSREQKGGFYTQESIRSRNSNSSLSGRIHRLPEKLRIIKPLEGSLTLHHWSRLATPHLGGVLEERLGVAIKGNPKFGLDPLVDLYRLEEDEEEKDGELMHPSVRENTRTYNTLTNSTVLHPDTTILSSSYSTQISSGFNTRDNSRPTSRMSTRSNSVCEPGGRAGMYSVSTDLGLARILNQRKISGVRRSQLDLSSSLTPSVLNSPTSSRNLSPTCTPPHTPEESLPGSPDDDSTGLVYSFFSSLKTALYGEQRKEERTHRHKRKMEAKRVKLGIMEAVEEAGVDHLLSDRESTPGSLPSLSIVSGEETTKKKGSQPPILSDFDARYLGALDDFDELEDIEPGCLTLYNSDGWKSTEDYTAAWIGQLTVPSLTVTGRPGLEKKTLGSVPRASQGCEKLKVPAGLYAMGGRGPGRIVSPGEKRPQIFSGLGVPGHAGTGAVGQAVGPRRDLGTIPGASSFDLDLNVTSEEFSLPRSESFVGTLTNMFFGRKGGLL